MEQQKQYNFIQTPNRDNVKQLSMTGVLKPLSIGTVTNICKQDINFLKAKINNQLRRVTDLKNRITIQLNNPKYQKVQSKNILDLKILKKCEQIHRNYFNKILYYRSKTFNPNVMFITTMQTSYRNMLFELNQEYLRIRLQMRGVDLNENPLRNINQFQKV